MGLLYQSLRLGLSALAPGIIAVRRAFVTQRVCRVLFGVRFSFIYDEGKVFHELSLL